MTATAADIGQQYDAKSAKRDRIRMFCKIPIGATGAVGTLTKDDPDITVTRSATGTYDVTFPKGQDIHVNVSWKSTTLIGWRLNAYDATAGTFTVKTLAESAGTIAVTDPGNGDDLFLEIWAATRAD